MRSGFYSLVLLAALFSTTTWAGDGGGQFGTHSDLPLACVSETGGELKGNMVMRVNIQGSIIHVFFRLSPPLEAVTLHYPIAQVRGAFFDYVNFKSTKPVELSFMHTSIPRYAGAKISTVDGEATFAKGQTFGAPTLLSGKITVIMNLANGETLRQSFACRGEIR